MIKIFFQLINRSALNGVSYKQSGKYSQVLKAQNGCDSTLMLSLTIKKGVPATIKAGRDTTICEGDILPLQGIFTGQASIHWTSSGGQIEQTNKLITQYHAELIGDHYIYLRATDDCKQWLDSFSVKVSPRQIVKVTGDTIINPCNEIIFTVSGGTNYIWTPSSYIECLDPPCSSVILKSASVNRYTISTDGPCAVPASLNLFLSKIESDIYLPNVFSPNGDNINDIFQAVFNCEKVNYYNLQIFDRWGNVIFYSLDKDRAWDGKYKNIKLNPGVYLYIIQYKVHGSEMKIKTGNVTLIR